MASHKNQHFIPRCYLKAWCDPFTPAKQTPYVWYFSKDGNTVKKKSPENLFYEKEMYSIKDTDGSRNLVLEHGLSQLESQFSSVRDKKLRARKELTEDEHFVLCAFVAAMHARTVARREHLKNEYGKIVEMMDKMKERIKTFTPEQREESRRRAEIEKTLRGDAPTFSEEETRQMADQPIQELLVPTINSLTPILAIMEMVILETNTNPGFITTDDPCVWFDPEAYKRPPSFQAPGLMYPSTEIRLPLSPNQLLVFKREFNSLNGYVKIVDNNIVDEINWLTRLHSHESIIVNANIKKDVWFGSKFNPENANTRPI